LFFCIALLVRHLLLRISLSLSLSLSAILHFFLFFFQFQTNKPNVDAEEIKAIAATEKKEVEWVKLLMSLMQPEH
jgi:hypothetical protein